MNERIKELEKQATDIVDAFDGPIGVFNLEKFAELIIRECLGIVDGEGCGEGGSVRSIKKIKEHFGVSNE